MTEKFEAGDLVTLKSGGPAMTYGGENTYGDALCYWFEGKNRRRETFHHIVPKRADGRQQPLPRKLPQHQ
jgi:uncharacterized protein YodC (DUF2158 family)